MHRSARGIKEAKGSGFYALILSHSLALTVIRNRGLQDMQHNVPDVNWIIPKVKYVCHRGRKKRSSTSSSKRYVLFSNHEFLSAPYNRNANE